ncbi:hypothetical protein JD969_02260 [Planctomycetota bacterium]|nr:hypothetical protein JD969_02260 [Planctomycetota bacterium]
MVTLTTGANAAVVAQWDFQTEHNGEIINWEAEIQVNGAKRVGWFSTEFILHGNGAEYRYYRKETKVVSGPNAGSVSNVSSKDMNTWDNPEQSLYAYYPELFDHFVDGMDDSSLSEVTQNMINISEDDPTTDALGEFLDTCIENDDIPDVDLVDDGGQWLIGNGPSMIEDTDGDGLVDVYDDDLDGDGVLNTEDNDTDGDGVNDSVENGQGTNPYKQSDFLDDDGDGKYDFGDDDGDGVSNSAEHAAGTDPDDANDFNDLQNDGIADPSFGSVISEVEAAVMSRIGLSQLFGYGVIDDYEKSFDAEIALPAGHSVNVAFSTGAGSGPYASLVQSARDAIRGILVVGVYVMFAVGILKVLRQW